MHSPFSRNVAAGMVIAAVLASLQLPAAVGAAWTAPPGTLPAAQARIEREDVATFLDTALPRQLALADALYLLFAVGLLVLAADAITYGVSAALIIVLLLPLVATALALASLIFAARGWQDQAWGGVIGRVHYGSAILAAATLVGWLYVWNLLGFRF